ncbi:hypothetical protein [Massilia brevitalea]|uniref:hypothetical protein n=1 Tax=Massilia brevitalea TaxID=442526 RepID=UPI00273998AF|nr:hypothetical protein [Massilia brevitalea]
MTAFAIAECQSAALQDVQTLDELFAWRVRQSPLAPAYLSYDMAAQDWRSVQRVSAVSRRPSRPSACPVAPGL